VDLRPELRTLSVCSGGGGLDLGVELALPGARPVCLVERDVFAAAHLVQKMEAGLLAPAPIWSDLRTFDGGAWRGAVDLFVGGIPCQPHSQAGRRGGLNDPRDLWDDARRVIEESEPGLVFLENVDGFVSSALERVTDDLRGMGLRTTAGLFTAAEVGAPHERRRCFVLAVGEPRRLGLWGEGDPRHEPGPMSSPGGGGLAESRRGGLQLQPVAGDPRPEAGRGSGEGVQRERVRDSARDVCPDLLFPPGPAELDLWRGILERYPDLSPSTESRVRGVAHGVADRVDRLRMLGNGVVPLEAAYAFLTLWAALEEG
jgi:DNA (cytosine-5)-methyltransferase 1